jgi:diketogulonate reductase-like aldo/keto reductase
VKQIDWGRTGATLSMVGQGTWNLETYDETEAIRAIRHGVELGMRHVDTAYDYGLGAAESFLGKALDGIRDEVFLVSKILPQHASYEGTLKACEYSLGRLRTDRLDALLLHWWEGEHPLEETFRAFERLVEQGKIRSWGVSNFDVSELEQALAIVGEGRIACNQVVYNLQSRDIERGLLEWCRARGITVVGYAPYGDVRAPGTLFEDTMKLGGDTLRPIAEAHGVSARNVALAFLMRQGVPVIPKGERVEFAADNARAAALELTEAEWAAIDRAFPVPAERPIPFTNAYYAAQSG